MSMKKDLPETRKLVGFLVLLMIPILIWSLCDSDGKTSFQVAMSWFTALFQMYIGIGSYVYLLRVEKGDDLSVLDIYRWPRHIPSFINKK